MRTTSRRYDRPTRPKPVAWLNRLGAPGGAEQALDPKRLMLAARRKAGLHDFGSPWFREPLERLVDSLEREARLTPVGRSLMRSKLKGSLVQRLRLRALLERHPEILATRVVPPVVIAGLQRTGTTMLQRLLGSDPRARTVATYEALEPVPVLRGLPPALDPRLHRARAAQALVRWMAPDFFAVHPIQADAPEEDIVLLDHGFASTVAEASHHVPSYARWLESFDPTPAYRELLIWLKLLQWQRPGRFWVLKTPHHLEWLDSLFEVFPEAIIVQTHRDPRVSVASFCSMVAHGRGVFSDHVDPHEIGRHWLAKIARMVRRSTEVRSRQPAERFIDIEYEDLVEAPVPTLQRVYGRLHLEPPADLDARVHDWLRANPARRYGRHVYDSSSFGLTLEAIDAALASEVPGTRRGR